MGADRLENEHLGNVDQYRITREVPLPYSFDEAGQDDDHDESDAQAGVTSGRMAWLFYRKRQSEQNTNSDSN